MLPNFSNRPGGYSGFADSGAAHGLHLAGISMTPEPYAATQKAASGAVDITGAVKASLPALTQPRSTQINLPSESVNLVSTS